MTRLSSLAEIRTRIDGLDGGLVRLPAERQSPVRAAASFEKDAAAVRAPTASNRSSPRSAPAPPKPASPPPWPRPCGGR